jgi:hypothetical protein
MGTRVRACCRTTQKDAGPLNSTASLSGLPGDRWPTIICGPDTHRLWTSPISLLSHDKVAVYKHQRGMSRLVAYLHDQLVAERSPDGLWTVHDVLSDLLSPGDDVTRCINTRPRPPSARGGRRLWALIMDRAAHQGRMRLDSGTVVQFGSHRIHVQDVNQAPPSAAGAGAGTPPEVPGFTTKFLLGEASGSNNEGIDVGEYVDQHGRRHVPVVRKIVDMRGDRLPTGDSYIRGDRYAPRPSGPETPVRGHRGALSA